MAKNAQIEYVTPSGMKVTPPAHINKPKSQVTIFNIINGIVFVLVCLIILVPIWKVLIDSLDLTSGYGMKLLPSKFGLDGYLSIFTNKC